MAGTALDDAAGMALQLDSRQIVIGGRQRIRPDRMGRSMATFAGDVAVTQAVAVECIAIFRKSFVDC